MNWYNDCTITILHKWLFHYQLLYREEAWSFTVFRLCNNNYLYLLQIPNLLQRTIKNTKYLKYPQPFQYVNVPFSICNISMMIWKYFPCFFHLSILLKSYGKVMQNLSKPTYVFFQIWCHKVPSGHNVKINFIHIWLCFSKCAINSSIGHKITNTPNIISLYT